MMRKLRENGIPPPDRDGARHGHGKNDEKVFIGKRDQQRVHVGLSPQPLQQGSILVQQQERYESSWHREQGEHQADAEIEAFAIGVASAAEDAGGEEVHHPPEWTLAVVVPQAKGRVNRVGNHAAFIFITVTTSRATLIVSTSSTR